MPEFCIFKYRIMTLPPRHTLSKSTFMYGCQCPKRLWLHKFQPDVRDEVTEAQASIFQAGTNIGMLARQLFPYGVDASPETPYKYQQSVADTEKYIRKGVNVIYEAAFQFEGILAAIDILVKKGDKWYAFEVKGTGSVKPPHVQDAALQYYVITQSGIPLEDISIVHLNTDYVRYGDLDIDQLFTCTSVAEEVKEQQPFIVSKAIELMAMLKSKQLPAMEIGDHCFKPYDCDFYGFCSKGLTEEEINEEKYINQEAIAEFLSQLKYPLQFLDFETWMTAVPEQDGHWSFRQVPFQFSLHIQQKAGDELVHRYYLADGPQDNHLVFAEKLLEALEKKGTILAYNKTFENTILNHLKEEFEHLSKQIEKIQERMVDLMAPFRKNYRLPAMKGSYSIKYVLPALVPELSYDSLAIGNGGDASAAFYNLKDVEDETQREVIRKALLEYCALDTMAMVRILEKLSLIKQS
jgi:hypothetical protein